MIYYKISPSLEPNNGSLSKGEKRGKKEKKGERRRKKGGKWGKMQTNGENTVKNVVRSHKIREKKISLDREWEKNYFDIYLCLRKFYK